MAMNNMFQWVRQVSGKLGAPMVQSIDQTSPQHQSFMRQLQKDLKAKQPLLEPLDTLDFTVLDLETSGFYPDGGDKILSIGAVKVKKGKVVYDETYYSTICEPDALSPEVSGLTGLTKEELDQSPSISEVLQSFYEFINTDILVAHHAKHEKKFLQHATYQSSGMQFRHRLLDTSFLYQIAVPGQSAVELDACCDYYDIPINNRHHALADAIMAAELWVCTIQEAMQIGYETLQDVYVHLNRQPR
ncbi:3'-5' exonuclease [Salibacterium salarium]|uniref:3'-5' exonuclease n=1 Tax=Salibacterium salarium TaxID=284579 RepID=A0A3R9NYF9_9BACI|nr:exonuclease domain-containing protein [Salibacterium salarium]RSL28847.1 3'-5' exonuclease [Salibacterium salarium]